MATDTKVAALLAALGGAVACAIAVMSAIDGVGGVAAVASAAAFFAALLSLFIAIDGAPS